MFDNPRKELDRLQRELLAAEEPPAEPEEDSDPEEAFYEMKELLAREEWDEEEREPLFQRYARGEEPEELHVDEEPPRKPEKKKGGIGGLVIAIMLETLALLALLAWWLLWS